MEKGNRHCWLWLLFLLSYKSFMVKGIATQGSGSGSVSSGPERVGQRCDEAIPCADNSNTLCDIIQWNVVDPNGKCKIKANLSCEANADHCVSHSICTGSPKTCKCDDGYPIHPVGFCAHNGGTSLFVCPWLFTGSVIWLLLTKFLS